MLEEVVVDAVEEGVLEELLEEELPHLRLQLSCKQASLSKSKLFRRLCLALRL